MIRIPTASHASFVIRHDSEELKPLGGPVALKARGTNLGRITI